MLSLNLYLLWRLLPAKSRRKGPSVQGSGPRGERVVHPSAEVDPALLYEAGFGGRMAITTFLILRAQQPAGRLAAPTSLQLQRERR